MMRKRLFVSLVLLLMCRIAVQAAGVPLVQQMLPASGSVKGFTILAKSMQYGKGDGLTDIYNGGYELYTEAGVVDAARQMYMRGSDSVEVTIHTMKSPKAAMDFLKYWQKENHVKALTKTKTSTYFLLTKPDVIGYWVTGKYFTTVAGFYPAAKAGKDAKAFATAVEKKVVGLGKR